jgi:hypothetical protein
MTGDFQNTCWQYAKNNIIKEERLGSKDIISHDYMSDNEHFADAFDFYFYDGKRVIDPDRLKDEDSAETAIISGMKGLYTTKKTRDILKSLNIKSDGKATYVLMGVENQSKVHYAMPVRNLLYDALSYAAQVSDQEKKLKNSGEKLKGSEYLSGFKKGGKISPVITLVINWGKEKWDGPTKLSEMLVDTTPEIRSAINDYEIKLIDPYSIDDFSKFNTMLGDVLEIIKNQDADNFLKKEAKEKWPEWKLDVASINTINEFTGANIPISEVEEGGLINMCRMTEALIEEGIEQGTDLVNSLNRILLSTGRLDDLTRAASDSEYQKQLIKELVPPVGEE